MESFLDSLLFKTCNLWLAKRPHLISPLWFKREADVLSLFLRFDILIGVLGELHHLNLVLTQWALDHCFLVFNAPCCLEEEKTLNVKWTWELAVLVNILSMEMCR